MPVGGDAKLALPAQMTVRHVPDMTHAQGRKWDERMHKQRGSIFAQTLVRQPGDTMGNGSRHD